MKQYCVNLVPPSATYVLGFLNVQLLVASHTIPDVTGTVLVADPVVSDRSERIRHVQNREPPCHAPSGSCERGLQT